jgi:hypothetical protein
MVPEYVWADGDLSDMKTLSQNIIYVICCILAHQRCSLCWAQFRKSFSPVCTISWRGVVKKAPLVLSSVYNRAPEQSQQLETLTYQNADSDGWCTSAHSGASSHNTAADVCFSLALNGRRWHRQGDGNKMDPPDSAVSLSLVNRVMYLPVAFNFLTSLANIWFSSKFLRHWIGWVFKQVVCLLAASVVLGSEFLATDPEVRVPFPALLDFLRSSGSGTMVFSASWVQLRSCLK